MAIALDPRKNYKEGIIRCITSREGNVQIKGYVDRSDAHVDDSFVRAYTLKAEFIKPLLPQM